MADDQATDGIGPEMAVIFAKRGYQVERLLHRGIYGDVYLGVDTRAGNKPVAVKVVMMDKLATKVKQEFLPREVTALAGYMQHPNIVHTHDIFKSGQKVGH